MESNAVQPSGVRNLRGRARSRSCRLLGVIHGTLLQTAEARQEFREALRLDPRDPTAYVNLGLLELSSGNRAAAADLFAEALSLDPASATARRRLAQAR